MQLESFWCPDWSWNVYLNSTTFCLQTNVTVPSVGLLSKRLEQQLTLLLGAHFSSLSESWIVSKSNEASSASEFHHSTSTDTCSSCVRTPVRVLSPSCPKYNPKCTSTEVLKQFFAVRNLAGQNAMKCTVHSLLSISWKQSDEPLIDVSCLE